MTANVGDWVGEITSTTGSGDIILGGVISGYASFATIPDGPVWYAITEGTNRESGKGILSGGDTLVRSEISATLIDNVYTSNPSVGLPLQGLANVYSTFNEAAFEEINECIERTASGIPYDNSDSDYDSDTVKGALDESTSIRETVALSLNTPIESVIYSDNTNDVLDGIIYIHNKAEDITWGKPAGVAVGDKIVSVSGSSLQTTNNTYTMKTVNPVIQLIPGYNIAIDDSDPNRPVIAVEEYDYNKSQIVIIARSLNVEDDQVIYSTDTTTILDDVLYIYDAESQTTWRTPALNGTDETIISLTGSTLVTSASTYTLYEIINAAFIGSVAAMVGLTSSVGDVFNTKSYYDGVGQGGGKYIIKPGVADNIVDHDVGGGLIAELQFVDYPSFEQCGGVLFDSRSDPSFSVYDAGIAVNAAVNNDRVHGLISGSRGYANLQTGIVISKPFSLNLGGVEWAGVNDGNFEFAVHPSIPEDQAILVESGVRQVSLKNFKLKVYTFGTGKNGIRVGTGDYSVDPDYINSNICLDNISSNRFENGFVFRQIFLTQINNCQSVESNFAGYYFENGGTSVSMRNSNVDGGQYGFCDNFNVNTVGLIYSSMISCVVENTTVSAYLFRSSSVQMVGCGQEKCAGSIFTVMGASHLTVGHFDNLNANTAKPDQIFNVLPDSAGRFGSNITMESMSTSITGFSGDQVQFLNAPATAPTSSLSTARWEFSEACFKQDPTACLDSETWKSGIYYRNYVSVSEQIDSSEIYLRSGQSQANIELEQNTRYNISGQLISGAGNMYIELELNIGSKTIIDAAEVDIVTTANADPSKGKILHCDTQTNGPHTTGNLYLKAFNKAGENMRASVSSQVLILKMDDPSMTGQLVIEKKKTLLII